LETELAKYSKNRGLHKKGKDGRRKDEADVLAALNHFRGRLKSTMAVDAGSSQDAADESGEGEANHPEDPGIEVDTDSGFLGHVLHFPKDDNEEELKAERDYEVIDPRQRNARAKEVEREKRKLKREERDGHGGRYRR
jgi:peptidyl-prolyl cis-trans isomerase SDCCAG10